MPPRYHRRTGGGGQRMPMRQSTSIFFQQLPTCLLLLFGWCLVHSFRFKVILERSMPVRQANLHSGIKNNEMKFAARMFDAFRNLNYHTGLMNEAHACILVRIRFHWSSTCARLKQLISKLHWIPTEIHSLISLRSSRTYRNGRRR